jgi:hypothetical protein
MSAAFILVFAVAAPFWTLMIVAPKWGVTQRLISTPWIATPPLIFWFILAIPRLGDLLPVFLKPTLAGWQDLQAEAAVVTLVWAQVIAWDLFIGRWMYQDSRERDIHPLVMGPLLVLTIMLSPIAVPLYLIIRKPLSRRDRQSAPAAAERPSVPV